MRSTLQICASRALCKPILLNHKLNIPAVGQIDSISTNNNPNAFFLFNVADQRRRIELDLVECKKQTRKPPKSQLPFNVKPFTECKQSNRRSKKKKNQFKPNRAGIRICSLVVVVAIFIIVYLFIYEAHHKSHKQIEIYLFD